MIRTTARRDARPPHDRRLVAIAAMLANGAAELDAGRWNAADAAGLCRAVAADAYALAYGYAAALDVPIGARLPEHAAAAIARAAGDDAPIGGQHAAA